MGSSIGVDIGTTGVRAVESVTSGTSVTVRRSGAVDLPPGAVVDGLVQDPDAVGAALKTLWRKYRFRSRKISLVLGSNEQILIRQASVPYTANKTHMEVMVRRAASDQMPVDVDGLVLSHHVVAVRTELAEDGSSNEVADIVLIGAHRTAVDTLVRAVEIAGLHPVRIDATVFALTRFVTQAASGPGRLDFVVHMGADTVLLIGLTGGQFAFIQSMNHYSGQMITEDIQTQINGTLAAAEKLKLSAGAQSAALPVHGAEVVGPVMAAWITAIVREIREALISTSRGAGMPVGRVWLSGGGAGLPSLAQRLGAELSDGTSVANLDASAWVSAPEKLLRVSESTGHDLTVALAASIK